ncbi:WhiB family transcriptional regulator [Corynebacterium heidelbergense]|uniref:4Fe-4S Wbl-type domain-containing protein n=1 Tax=Corynebacterium heidelbergense TaxID=2055947 RepID=A0A364V734_9CORY|nr:WhiB family transcriptional regulator [Corynebacterium heidelbergense]RAV32366.1 hypothetical protein CWC39_10495 [Corynebacterium heidelbergense]WCZ36179.1 Transcriptional regulator WhiD [Corynebacterium heidelbergense]WCZ37634.1 Transcriptional regulator WhiD [Corynebacterium heidelbergense]
MMIRPGTEWMDRAACHGVDAALIDASPTRGRNLGAIHRYAAELCRECPVQRECAADALATRAEGVIRAGVPVPERAGNKVRRRMAFTRLRAIAGVGP